LRPVHFITLAVAIAVTALLYWGGNTVPPAKHAHEHEHAGDDAPHQAGMPSGPNTMKAASFDSILSAAKSSLPAQAAAKVATIEDELSAIRDSSRMAVVFYKLTNFWQDNNDARIAAFYAARAAKLENSEKKLNFAGQFFLDRIAEDSSEALQMWDAERAAENFQYALDINPDNDTAKMGLAQSYVATGQPMKGVGLLREIVAKKPNDVPANMILGKMSIQSGQYPKAVPRFEKVLETEPNNSEAMYFMAVAYKEQGNKDKAIELLEKCKKIVNNPDFSRDIDNYINTFK
jgi:lipopolysaccharide biosynthesis regulator YciM